MVQLCQIHSRYPHWRHIIIPQTELENSTYHLLYNAANGSVYIQASDVLHLKETLTHISMHAKLQEDTNQYPIIIIIIFSRCFYSILAVLYT